MGEAAAAEAAGGGFEASTPSEAAASTAVSAAKLPVSGGDEPGMAGAPKYQGSRCGHRRPMRTGQSAGSTKRQERCRQMFPTR